MEYSEEREPPDVLTSDTDNATKVQPKDAPPHKKAKFRRFRAYNRGTWNGPKRENKEVIRRQDDLHRYDSVASTLLLNKYQKNRGRKIFDDLDFHHFGQKIDHIIFGVCVIVANADVENGSRFYPNPDAADDENFSDFADSVGMTRGEQVSSIEKVRSRTNF